LVYWDALSNVPGLGNVAFILKVRLTLLRDTGAAISPFNSWQLIQGLETLALRQQRHSENYPEKFLPYLAPGLRTEFVGKALQGRPRADAYLRFLVEELKPAIDARFATLPGPQSTFIMGSSMGALISLYALSEYPQVFGGAAGLSVHWPGAFQSNAALPLAAFNYLHDRLPSPQGQRLYMDRGTTELDALYGPYQNFVDEIVRDRGWGAGQLMSQVFEGTGHSERAWAARLEVPLLFLMGR
jgi:pimeloyl-ACP methyl ester carboxylesterase